MSNATPWHMGISEVHLFDSLCFFFNNFEHTRGKISIEKTNETRAKILSEIDQYDSYGSIFQKIDKGHTVLLPDGKKIAEKLKDMYRMSKFDIRSLFIYKERRTSHK